METLYYPYLCPQESIGRAMSVCFGKLYSLTPLALRPRFPLPMQKFLDPLPKEWQEPFRAIINQYRIFAQTYTDKSFLEYLKHAPIYPIDEEKTSILVRLLKNQDIEKAPEMPKEVISAVFLHLAEQYRQNVLEMYQAIKRIVHQEQELKKILDTKEIKVPDFDSPQIDYIHPDEGLSNFLDKILKAFSNLLPEKEFDIFVTDDEVVHQYIKESVKNLDYYNNVIYFSDPGEIANLWEKLATLPSNHFTKLESLISPFKAKKDFSLEILIFPGLIANKLFLNILTGQTLEKENKNAIFIWWR